MTWLDWAVVVLFYAAFWGAIILSNIKENR